MDLKKKFEAAKQKAKEYAPELIAAAAVIVPIAVFVVSVKNHASNGYVLDDEDNNTSYKTITSEEMAKRLQDGSMYAFGEDGDDLTFYTISDPED